MIHNPKGNIKMEKKLDDHKRMLFNSKEKADWKEKDSWVKRACLWKYLAIAIESTECCKDEKLKSLYESALSADLESSPPIEVIQYISTIAIPAFNNRHKSKIEVVKG